jgi:hypothetical protein
MYAKQKRVPELSGPQLNEREEALRQRITKLLADGLATQTEPAPEDQRQVAAILAQLRALRFNLEDKLVKAGLTNHPYGEERRRCQHCMHYSLHGKFCALPELSMPVEPHWYCRVWHI